MSLLLAFMMSAAAEQVGLANAKERQAMQIAGQCIVSERSIEVRKLLSMDFRDKAYGRAMHKLVNGLSSCRGYTVPTGVYSAGGLLWGGTLAEGILRRDKVLDNLAARTGYNPALPDIEARNGGEYLAICAIRTSPAEVVALLRAEPATSDESAAFDALRPTFGGCMPKNTNSAEFTREALRALLALGAQRLAVHNDQGGSSGREAAK